MSIHITAIPDYKRIVFHINLIKGQKNLTKDMNA